MLADGQSIICHSRHPGRLPMATEIGLLIWEYNNQVMKSQAKPVFCPFCDAKLPVKVNRREQIIKAIGKRPDLSYQRIADKYKVGKITVIRYAKKAGIRRPQKSGKIWSA